jgi:hypothetical protein
LLLKEVHTCIFKAAFLNYVVNFFSQNHVFKSKKMCTAKQNLFTGYAAVLSAIRVSWSVGTGSFLCVDQCLTNVLFFSLAVETNMLPFPAISLLYLTPC